MGRAINKQRKRSRSLMIAEIASSRRAPPKHKEKISFIAVLSASSASATEGGRNGAHHCTVLHNHKHVLLLARSAATCRGMLGDLDPKLSHARLRLLIRTPTLHMADPAPQLLLCRSKGASRGPTPRLWKTLGSARIGARLKVARGGGRCTRWDTSSRVHDATGRDPSWTVCTTATGKGIASCGAFAGCHFFDRHQKRIQTTKKSWQLARLKACQAAFHGHAVLKRFAMQEGNQSLARSLEPKWLLGNITTNEMGFWGLGSENQTPQGEVSLRGKNFRK